MSVIGLIPARGGSKGIPKKSIAPCAGKPLLAYTAAAALGASSLDRVILSTNDREIAEVGLGLGLEVPFIRPEALAQDATGMLDVMQHAVMWLAEHGEKVEAIVLLQPTSPLRRSEDIDQAYRLFSEGNTGSVVSVVEVPHQFNPISVMNECDGILTPFLPDAPLITRRQDKPKVYGRNGPAVLITRPAVIMAGLLYEQPICGYIMEDRFSIDIDSPADLLYAEFLLQHHGVLL